ncbi:uncharacterized protein PV09_00587 [Verruconis gallopava]|uniref:Thioesterase n=1 Tax=Verruconis gallopava TaxID=253628 RepID=A0A0D1Y0N5_9PEZI|nr:uncharacterized protein PV09_00587 [Verruconis gallopava]KIW08631.1 hypothetical protein PV09_00587 [Verruconis gallopava]
MAKQQLSRLLPRALLNMDLSTFVLPTYHNLFRTVVLLLALANVKNLLGVWHYRVFRPFIVRLTRRPKRAVDPNCLFLPSIQRSHAPLLETDFNLHKSNSTYLTDIDITRANYAVLILGDHVATSPFSKKPKLILGGIQIIWRKEIPPYKEYEMWIRLLTWSDKWFYAVTHFVEKGKFKPALYLQDMTMTPEATKKMIDESAEKAKTLKETYAKSIYASAISRVVIKQGRQTVKPADMLAQAGLLPTDAAELAKVEERRLKYLKLVEDGGAWDGLHATFFDCTDVALGRYTDLFFR